MPSDAPRSPPPHTHTALRMGRRGAWLRTHPLRRHTTALSALPTARSHPQSPSRSASAHSPPPPRCPRDQRASAVDVRQRVRECPHRLGPFGGSSRAEVGHAAKGAADPPVSASGPLPTPRGLGSRTEVNPLPPLVVGLGRGSGRFWALLVACGDKLAPRASCVHVCCWSPCC